MNLLPQIESEFGPQSYYLDSASPPAFHPRLEGSHTCEVCVVGAGFTGLSAALNLAEAGYSVALLEGERIGWGASGRNGGQVLTGFAPSLNKIEGWVGEAHTRQLWEMSLEATQILQERMARHRIDAEYRAGYVLAAVRQRQMKDLAEEHLYVSRLGYDQMRMANREEVRALVKSERFQGGLVDMGSGHIHPLKYVRGLAKAATQSGVRIFEQSRVNAIHPGNPASRARAVTAAGEVQADHLVLCCNAYIGNLQREMRSRIMPVGTYIIASAPLGRELALSLLPTNYCVSDANFVLDYFRLSADWRMLFGGRVSYTTIPPAGLARRMRQRMLAVFPELRNTAITHAWGGFVDISMNRLPDIGRLPGNVYYAQGFSGQGVALTGLAGKVISDAIRGDAEKFDVFARIPHRPFPGGEWLRLPLLTLSALYSRLQDLI